MNALQRNLGRALVIGGAGFIGRHLVDRLLRDGVRVTVLTRTASTSLPRNVRVVFGDYGDPSTVQDLLDVDAVFHLASSTQPKSSNDNQIADVESNLIKTLRLLEQLREHPATRLVFVSSGGTVYGVPKSVPLAESHPTDPTCSYGIVKLAIEKYLQMNARLHGLDQVVLRVANPYGPVQKLHAGQGVIQHFIERIRHGQSLELWGDGSVVRDFLFIDDLVDALVRAARYDGANRVFNIGSGEGHRIIEIVNVVGSCLGVTPSITFLPARDFDVPVNVLDIRCASQALQWTPRVRLQEGIQRTVDSLP